MLASIICFSLFIFFVNREIYRIDTGINQIIGQQNVIRENITAIGTHVNGCVSSLTTRLDAVTQKVNLHASAIEKIEWDSSDDDSGDEDEDEDADADADAARDLDFDADLDFPAMTHLK